jgi:Sulfotransferase domain
MIDFLGIGAQKAGTTWLFRHLSTHPQIRFPAGKEIHFWPGKEIRFRDRRVSRGVNAWLDLFPAGPPEIRQGEITPAYAFLDVEVIAQIHKINPHLRLFYSIRNPIARAWSAAHYDREKIELLPGEVSHQWYIDHFLSQGSRKRGDFLGCLDNWLKVFSKENLQLIFLDDIEQKPKQVLGQLARHLDIDPSHFVLQNESALRIPVFTGPDLDVPPELLAFLRRIYAPQIEALGERLQRDVSSWLEWNGRRSLRAGGQILERTARQA